MHMCSLEMAVNQDGNQNGEADEESTTARTKTALCNVERDSVNALVCMKC